jgi:hypothetical protein
VVCLNQAEEDEQNDQGYGKPPGGEEYNQRGEGTQQEEK